MADSAVEPMSGAGQILWINTCSGQDMLKCSGGNDTSAVDRYNRVSAGIIPMPENQVAAFLPVLHEP